MNEVSAITLPDEEKIVILELWGTPEAFASWQRDVLAAEIERRAEARASQLAVQQIQTEVQKVRDQFPTVFSGS